MNAADPLPQHPHAVPAPQPRAAPARGGRTVPGGRPRASAEGGRRTASGCRSGVSGVDGGRGARPCGVLLVLLLGAAQAGAWDDRRAGDVLSFALPVATFAVETAHDRAGARQFAASFALTLGATEVLKRLTGVERPDGSDTLSFPSGHASRAFGAAAFVHRRHGFREAGALYGLAAYVGYTRVHALRHRWEDVAGSAGVALLSSAALVERRTRGPRGFGIAVGARSVRVQWSAAL